jgi:CBS domain-containing protein
MATKPRTTAHRTADLELKQRQTAHRSQPAKQPPRGARPAVGAKRQVNRDRERARDTGRRPKKYFVAKQLLTADRSEGLVKPPRPRPTIAPGRAPVIGRDVLVRDIMVQDVVTIDASASLLDAARQMRDANVGMLPVLADRRLRGIITDRDLAVRAMAQGIDPGSVPVTEFLSNRLITARPEWSTDQAMSMMANAHVGRLPVVDDSGGVLGVVTLSSLVLRSRDQEAALEAAKEVSRRSARRDAAGEVDTRAASPKHR